MVSHPAWSTLMGTTPEKPPTKDLAAIAARGLSHPEKLTHEEIRELCGRVLSEENRRAT
ncbi:hypothetical protein [Komagataeibacter oboediens]|uniref:Uncharacterized protein n=2 Tax=Komagataeibacter oboediens TaxID=65958 RepID=A0ABS5SPB6_9PROT|nr:hypothetical protein [Komagataeibacter oboediens]MBL7234710.1 hypothetical protein [Komagataeibacter oboediens]MBT0676112.1 hypothetical protein [Komagataeibacter oboediens]MBT0680144.1 hypothetical protein [Komagataeibacter oboediens]GBR37491.1 hypothetical protein AA11826_1679 [Komagataeibacter oboediens DSM 11826]